MRTTERSAAPAPAPAPASVPLSGSVPESVPKRPSISTTNSVMATETTITATNDTAKVNILNGKDALGLNEKTVLSTLSRGHLKRHTPTATETATAKPTVSFTTGVAPSQHRNMTKAMQAKSRNNKARRKRASKTSTQSQQLISMSVPLAPTVGHGRATDLETDDGGEKAGEDDEKTSEGRFHGVNGSEDSMHTAESPTVDTVDMYSSDSSSSAEFEKRYSDQDDAGSDAEHYFLYSGHGGGQNKDSTFEKDENEEIEHDHHVSRFNEDSLEIEEDSLIISPPRAPVPPTATFEESVIQTCDVTTASAIVDASQGLAATIERVSSAAQSSSASALSQSIVSESDRSGQPTTMSYVDSDNEEEKKGKEEEWESDSAKSANSLSATDVDANTYNSAEIRDEREEEEIEGTVVFESSSTPSTSLPSSINDTGVNGGSADVDTKLFQTKDLKVDTFSSTSPDLRKYAMSDEDDSLTAHYSPVKLSKMADILVGGGLSPDAQSTQQSSSSTAVLSLTESDITGATEVALGTKEDSDDGVDEKERKSAGAPAQHASPVMSHSQHLDNLVTPKVIVLKEESSIALEDIHSTRSGLDSTRVGTIEALAEAVTESPLVRSLSPSSDPLQQAVHAELSELTAATERLTATQSAMKDYMARIERRELEWEQSRTEVLNAVAEMSTPKSPLVVPSLQSSDGHDQLEAVTSTEQHASVEESKEEKAQLHVLLSQQAQPEHQLLLKHSSIDTTYTSDMRKQSRLQRRLERERRRYAAQLHRADALPSAEGDGQGMEAQLSLLPAKRHKKNKDKSAAPPSETSTGNVPIISAGAFLQTSPAAGITDAHLHEQQVDRAEHEVSRKRRQKDEKNKRLKSKSKTSSRSKTSRRRRKAEEEATKAKSDGHLLTQDQALVGAATVSAQGTTDSSSDAADTKENPKAKAKPEALKLSHTQAKQATSDAQAALLQADERVGIQDGELCMFCGRIAKTEGAPAPRSTATLISDALLYLLALIGLVACGGMTFMYAHFGPGVVRALVQFIGGLRYRLLA